MKSKEKLNLACVLMSMEKYAYDGEYSVNEAMDREALEAGDTVYGIPGPNSLSPEAMESFYAGLPSTQEGAPQPPHPSTLPKPVQSPLTRTVYPNYGSMPMSDRESVRRVKEMQTPDVNKALLPPIKAMPGAVPEFKD